ncbi:DMT family transporter [Orenia marismortui]|uniref:RarD protein n=1 Tax=Orenia marismortui TaxID=46469 RepID=A0A4R8HQM8_9FIRM|nr:DMT family transporter [Orenia marismortui]TDX59301.1 RarD protein [Orenia marismortui]
MFDKDKIGYLFIIIAMLIWGSIGVFVRLLPYSSELIVFYRVLFAFLFLLLLSVLKKDLKLNLLIDNKLLLLGSGITLSLNWLFFFQAVKKTTIANATLSYYTSPVMVVLLSVLFLKERLRVREIISLLLGILGISIMIFSPKNLLLDGRVGIVYGLLAAFCYSLFTLSSKMITDLSAQKLTLIQTGIATIILFPIVLGYELPDLHSIVLLVIMGVLHTALALVLYIKGLRLSKVQDVGILSYLDPLSAILFAMLFLSEIPSLSTFIGGILILLSSYLVISKN